MVASIYRLKPGSRGLPEELQLHTITIPFDQLRRRHDDATREYAYGPAEGLPDSKVGTFPQDLYDKAMKDGWLVISMKKDWKRIFAFE